MLARGNYCPKEHRQRLEPDTPDAFLFEESCEKFAKPIETALENRTGTGWDVRLAPIH
ncbi:hypothetical protein ACFRIC_16430 [Streptomyces sp. NPDC056738]|uniref:hypothetical protein n=1 Tax=Streptomyces sp. NPDC056738 TaxID=3345933 RepID=UPI0036A2D7F5